MEQKTSKFSLAASLCWTEDNACTLSDTEHIQLPYSTQQIHPYNNYLLYRRMSGFQMRLLGNLILVTPGYSDGSHWRYWSFQYWGDKKAFYTIHTLLYFFIFFINTLNLYPCLKSPQCCLFTGCRYYTGWNNVWAGNIMQWHATRLMFKRCGRIQWHLGRMKRCLFSTWTSIKYSTG